MNNRTAAQQFLLALVFSVATQVSAADNPIDNMMALWDYRDPAATETKFREILDHHADNPEFKPALLSQIARTYSLRREFARAHEILDEALAQSSNETLRANVMIELERGRTYNSDGKLDYAVIHFRQAFQLSEAHEFDDLSVDAAHMLGIAKKGRLSERWNLIAMAIAETSENPRAQGWLGSLYNNLGWTYFDNGEVTKALNFFEKGVEFRKARNQTREWQIARWTVARAHRELGQHDKAMSEQLTLLDEVGDDPSQTGYIHEELGELYLIKKNSKYKKHFAKAYEILSNDGWLVANESERLARLRELSAE